jgi:hypothetical protein
VHLRRHANDAEHSRHYRVVSAEMLLDVTAGATATFGWGRARVRGSAMRGVIGRSIGSATRPRKPPESAPPPLKHLWENAIARGLLGFVSPVTLGCSPQSVDRRATKPASRAEWLQPC